MGFSVWFSESLAKLPEELKNHSANLPARASSSVGARLRQHPRGDQKAERARRKKYSTERLDWERKSAGCARKANRSRKWMQVALESWPTGWCFRKSARASADAFESPLRALPRSGRNWRGFTRAIGMPLIEGYGLTEGGVVCFNPIDRPKSGSIGVKLPGVELRLADDGELLVKSPSLFSGYYKDPVTTAAVLRDGWLYTGDIAEFDSDDYVYITGRKKELIVSSNGKKIYPCSDRRLCSKPSPSLITSFSIGDRLPYVTALVTVNAADVARSVVAEVSKAVARVNQQLAPFEQIRKFRVAGTRFFH